MNNIEDCLKLSNQLCFPLYVCSKEITKKYTPILKELGLTYTQYITLLVIWEHKEIEMKDLENILYLDSGTLTPVLKKLENNGYIVKERDKTDSRNINIKITNEGILLKEKVKNVPSDVGNCLDISKEDAEQLYKLLYKIIGNINK